MQVLRSSESLYNSWYQVNISIHLRQFFP
jgi:hypothetical protein